MAYVPALVFAGFAFVASTLIVRFVLQHRGASALDIPNERSSHTIPTPRGGGIAIAVTTIVGVGFQLLKSRTLLVEHAAFLGACTAVATIGWLDDKLSLRARTRFLGQLLAAIILLAIVRSGSNAFVLALPVLGQFSLGVVGWVLATVWLVGLTNAYNFMDGIDGIAGSQAVVAGIGWCAVGFFLKEDFATIIGVLLAFSSLAFLRFNWAPARIFMGDVGSTFLGFIFAALPFVCSAQNRPALLGFAVFAVLPFITDAGITLCRRLLRGAPVWQAHREHYYQKLIISGRSHRSVTTLYAFFAVLSVALGAVWLRFSL